MANTFSPVNNLDSLSPVTTKGDLMVRNASMIQSVGVGANNTVLTADSTTASGTKWAATNSNVSIATLTGATTLPASSQYLLVSGTTFAITLPAAASNSGLQFIIRKTDDISTAISVGGSGFIGMTLNTLGEQYTILCDGTTYWPFNHFSDTEWAVYTPIVIGGGSFVGSSALIEWQRDGTEMKIRGFFKTGTTTGATAYLHLPAGAIISSAGVTTASALCVGMGVNSRTSTNGNNILILAGGTGVNWSVFAGSQNSNVPQLGSTIWTSGDIITFFCSVSISGWGA